MPWFIKRETFNQKAFSLESTERGKLLYKHKEWVIELKLSGIKISSGYLVNEKKKPGAGGFLILEAETYERALSIIEKDPMILNNLVNWDLHEWIPFSGEFPSNINEDVLP